MQSFIRRLILALVAGLLLQACSAVRLGYGHADSLARWWIDQYVDLSPEQDALLQDRLARFFAWHRKTQLPDYVAMLLQGKNFVAGQPSARDALTLGDGIVHRVQTMTEQAIPDIADLLLTVSPTQIERIAKRFAEKNIDYAKKARLAEDEPSQRTARYKRLQERAEFWFGDFSSAQEATLRQLIEGQSAGSQFWYEERLRRQREMLELMRQVQKERLPRDKVIPLLRDYAARFDLPVDPPRLAQAQALRRASAELAIAIHALTTPAQRAHAQRKLDELIHDFTELSQRD